MNYKLITLSILALSSCLLILSSCKDDKITLAVEANYIEPTFILGVKNVIKERAIYNREGDMTSHEMTVSSNGGGIPMTIKLTQKFDYLGNVVELKNFTNNKLHVLNTMKYNRYSLPKSDFRLEYNERNDGYDTTQMVYHYNENFTRAWRVTNGDTIGLTKLSFKDTIIQSHYNMPDTMNSRIIEKTLRDKDYKRLYYEKIYPENLSDKLVYEYDASGKLQQITTYSEGEVTTIEEFKRGVKTSKTIKKHKQPIRVNYRPINQVSI